MNPFNPLETTAIKRIWAMLHATDNMNLATIVYIQSLLQPYSDAIQNAINLDQINTWMYQALPEKIANNINAVLNDTLDQMVMPAALIGKGIGTDKLVSTAKSIIIELLIQALVDPTYIDTLQTPWDIAKRINDDPDLLQLFGPQPAQLPVTVMVNGIAFTHNMSLEFIAGLLLFVTVSGAHFSPITIFGHPVDDHDIMSRFIFNAYSPTKYTITAINKKVYGFDTTGFMQGVATGAQWAGVDHHNYWTRLIDHSTDTEVTF